MRLFAILFLVLLLPLGCAEKKEKEPRQAMDEDWRYFPCSMEDRMAFILVNVAIRESIDRAPTTLTKLRLTYKSVTRNGLPAREEFEPVKSIEERIEEFSKEADDWYVGRVTEAGKRHFYVYTNRPGDAWRGFLTKLQASSGYHIQLDLSVDAEHQRYREELYPSEDDWQVIKDLEVIENVERHGDDGMQPRKVDHWIYFDSKADSVDFVNWAKNDGFSEEVTDSSVTDDGKYCVRLSHYGTLNIGDISSRTIALRQNAAKHGGDYDGWETFVIKPGKQKVQNADSSPSGNPEQPADGR